MVKMRAGDGLGCWLLLTVDPSGLVKMRAGDGLGFLKGGAVCDVEPTRLGWGVS